MIFSHSRRLKKTIGISGNHFIISYEFTLFANVPDYLKAARSIIKKNYGYFKMSKKNPVSPRGS